MMPDETTKAILSHSDGKLPIPSAPLAQEVIPTVPNSVHLAIPTKKVLPTTLSFGPPETWVPYYIHTAKCDRCGQHNTSVVQRSSRENKQFCKACMYLNVRDGLYSVNVAGLDWSSRASSIKRRARSMSKHRKPQNLKKLLKSSISTRISKSNQRGPRARAKNRFSFTDHSEPGNATDTQIVPLDGIGEEEDETDDDIGFRQLPHCDFFSSERQAIRNTTTNSRAKTMLSTVDTEEVDLDMGNGGIAERETSQCVSDSDSHTQWWERTRDSESNARDENIHSSLKELQEPEVSADVLEAAKILLKMKKGAW